MGKWRSRRDSNARPLPSEGLCPHHVRGPFRARSAFVDGAGHRNRHVAGMIAGMLQGPMRAVLTLLSSLFLAGAAIAQPASPQRVPALVTGAWDGDTIDVAAELWLGMTWEGSVRVAGVDTPEIRGECEEERRMALQARVMVRELLVGSLVLLAGVHDDKYGGRVVATVLLEDGRDLADVLVDAGVGRPYDGGTRRGWCD